MIVVSLATGPGVSRGFGSAQGMRLGERAPGSVTARVMEVPRRRCESSAGDIAGSTSSTAAAAPALWGQAIDVPESVAVAVVELGQVEEIPAPGRPGPGMCRSC